jgi:hypothetical protein
VELETLAPYHEEQQRQVDLSGALVAKGAVRRVVERRGGIAEAVRVVRLRDLVLRREVRGRRQPVDAANVDEAVAVVALAVGFVRDRQPVDRRLVRTERAAAVVRAVLRVTLSSLHRCNVVAL